MLVNPPVEYLSQDLMNDFIQLTVNLHGRFAVAGLSSPLLVVATVGTTPVALVLVLLGMALLKILMRLLVTVQGLH